MKRASVFVAAACAAAVVNADTVKAARAEIASNSVNRTTECRFYKAWFAEGLSKEACTAIMDRNIAAHRRWMALEPTIPAPHSDLGVAYAALGRWKEAKSELEIAIAAGDRLDAKRRAQARWEMANCLWTSGDKAGARKMIAEAAALVERPGEHLMIADRAKYLAMMFSDPEADLDLFRLPHSVDGKPFPTPQWAKFGEGWVSLAKVEVKVKGTGNREQGTGNREQGTGNDPIVRLLKKKLGRFGTKFVGGQNGRVAVPGDRGGAATVIEIAISPNAPVEKPQGYALDVVAGRAACPQAAAARWGQRALPDAPCVRIRARTRLGALWGVVSLIQCVDRNDGGVNAAAQDKSSPPVPHSPFPVPHSPFPTIRECQIRDWPACERRGVIDYWQPDFLEYAIFNKMSSVSITMDRDFSLSPLDRERYRLFAKRMRDFGIETYFLVRNIAMTPILPFSSPRTWKFHLGRANFYASIGAGVSFNLDDHRFPMHPEDVKAAGTAANLDAKYMTRLYRTVKKSYPDFKMQLCPPFYWGPRSPASYPEPREPYLKSLAAELDPEIDVYWTGPYVKSQWMTDEYVSWFANLIGRKPTIFHNGNCIGQHYYIQFGADVTGYKKSHSPDLFKHIASFQHNMSRYEESSAIGSAMDWCWNPEAHDPETSVRRSDEQLEGPGVYEILAEATPSLSYFDRYVYGRPRSELFVEDQSNLDRRVADAEAAWAKVMAIAKNGGLFVRDFNECGIKWARRLAEYRRNPPEWLVKQRDSEMANTAFAEKEAAFDASKGDVFVPSEMLSGGRYFKNIKDRSKREPCAVKYVDAGTDTRLGFTCEPFPPDKPFTLVIVAMSFQDVRPFVEIDINGRNIWRGEAFTGHRFGLMEVKIPVDAIKRSNTVVIRNASASSEEERKAIVHYVIIRRR